MLNASRGNRALTAAALLIAATVPVSASIIIDPFTSSQALNAPNRADGTVQGPTLTSSGLNNAPLALGGQRELYYRYLYGTSAGTLNTNSDDFEAASFRTGTNGVANGLIVYDGGGTSTGLQASGSVNVANVTGATVALRTADANAKVKSFRFGAPDQFGLGAIDLTESGSNDRIRIGAYADNQGVQLVLRFFVSATSYAETVLNIPGSQNFGYNSYEVLFSDFTNVGLANLSDAFTGVNAITIQFNGETSTDASLDFFSATNGIPEPGTYSLMGLALVGLGAIRRRFKA